MTCPDDVEQGVWDDWLTLRKAKKAPVTDTVLKMLRLEAEKCGKNLQEVLEICCMNGWQGFRVDWLKNQQPSQAAQFKAPISHVLSIVPKPEPIKRELTEDEMAANRLRVAEIMRGLKGKII